MTSAPVLHLWLIPLLPFAGFLLNGLLGRRLPNPIVSTISLLATGAPFLLVLNIAAHFTSLSLPYVETLGPWMQAGSFHADFSFALDQLTLIMLLVVTGVGFLIHVYSIGYMAHEEGFWRFFAYLNLFMFFMLTLVLAENFLLVFVGWEGVGLASYLLIGFYFTRNSAANAGKKAFVVNRIGDFGFLLAMFLVIAHFGTLSFHQVFAAIAQHPELHGGFLTAIALCLVLGAAGKSAQIPLYVWLPDAMEGPTPVSALIHAATMVTAGVYMTVRCHAIFDRSPLALSVVAIIGAATAFFAATVGMVQTDIKRVLAYSTISQLGYMFLACGVAAYSAGIFHLLTHAFFKALLFLAAGSVIHALNGEQDMREMGGLKSKVPVTYWTMTAGVVAIAGIPPFAGFVSKDEILYRTFQAPGIGPLLWSVGLVTAFLTSFYMFRLWFLTFWGERRTSHTGAHTPEPGHGADALHTGHGVHESPGLMLVPLAILAILSIIGGWVGWPHALGGGDWFGKFLDPVTTTETVTAEQGVVKWFNDSKGYGFLSRSNGQDVFVSRVAIQGNGFPSLQEGETVWFKVVKGERGWEAKGVSAISPQRIAPATEANRTAEYLLIGASTLVALAGFFVAYLFYVRRPELPARLAERSGTAYRALVNKYWLDEIYGATIVRPLNAFARIGLWWTVDRGLIDGTAYAAAGSAAGLGAIVRRLQSGNIRSYAGWLAGGAAALLLLMYYGLDANSHIWFARWK